ncbi:MAG: phage tail protein [Pyrinomonadaceae bacterium]
MPSMGANAAMSLASSLSGVRLNPFRGFNFFVEIEGILTGGFSECSGLQVETETMDYPEGGLNDYVHRFRGRTKYPALTLKHGLTMIDGLWSWHQDVIQGNVERKNGTIYLLNRMHLPVLWWDFKGGFPTKWTGPDFRADSNSVAFESVEIAHQGLSRPSAALVAAAFGAAVGD